MGRITLIILAAAVLLASACTSYTPYTCPGESKPPIELAPLRASWERTFGVELEDCNVHAFIVAPEVIERDCPVGTVACTVVCNAPAKLGELPGPEDYDGRLGALLSSEDAELVESWVHEVAHQFVDCSGMEFAGNQTHENPAIWGPQGWVRKQVAARR